MLVSLPGVKSSFTVPSPRVTWFIYILCLLCVHRRSQDVLDGWSPGAVFLSHCSWCNSVSFDHFMCWVFCVSWFANYGRGRKWEEHHLPSLHSALLWMPWEASITKTDKRHRVVSMLLLQKWLPLGYITDTSILNTLTKICLPFYSAYQAAILLAFLAQYWWL